MPKVPYPYEVNGKLVTGNGFLISACSLSNSSLLTVLRNHFLRPICHLLHKDMELLALRKILGWPKICLLPSSTVIVIVTGGILMNHLTNCNFVFLQRNIGWWRKIAPKRFARTIQRYLRWGDRGRTTQNRLERSRWTHRGRGTKYNTLMCIARK